MHITIGAPVPGASWLQRLGETLPLDAGTIPGGQLINQRVALIGDSRASEPYGFRRYVGGAAESLHFEGDYTVFANAGFTIDQLNDTAATGYDLVGQALESDVGVFVVIAGYNDIVNAQVQAERMMNRMNAVRVPVTGESGVFARDSSGAYQGWGDACSDGAGGTGVVTHVAGGFAWIAAPSGLANGDVITCANSDWSATLAGDPPAHSGRLVIWVSEIPASSWSVPATMGPAHQAFHDWLETGPFDGLSHIHCRTVDVMEELADTPNPPGYPFPYKPNHAYDDIHCRNEACVLGSNHIGPQIDALLGNYPGVFPRPGAAPAGATDLASTFAFTGGVSESNGVRPADWLQWGAGRPPISLVGADGDPDREFRVTLSGTSPSSTPGELDRFPNWTDPGYDVLFRFGVEVLVTNTAGDGPPVGLGALFDASARLTLPDGSTTVSNGIKSDDVLVNEWTRLLLPDMPFATGTGGPGYWRVQLFSYYASAAPVDAVIRWRRPCAWLIPA